MIQFGMPTLIENRIPKDNVALCESLGLKFIELNMNFPEYQVDKLEQTDGFRDYEKKAIEYLLKSPVFGLTWDIGHSKATGEKDVPFIMEHSEHLMHFHIHDGSENPPKNHLALGDGEIDLSARLRLAESKNARCVLETKTIEALKKSVQWLDEKKK